jgi:hypothetical protein
MASSSGLTSATRRVGAGTAGSADGADWNNPPAVYQAWHDFVYNLVQALREFPNVFSYEIYNEQNSPQWWDGSIREYKETLRQGALAIRPPISTRKLFWAGLYFPMSSGFRQLPAANTLVTMT